MVTKKTAPVPEEPINIDTPAERCTCCHPVCPCCGHDPLLHSRRASYPGWYDYPEVYKHYYTPTWVSVSGSWTSNTTPNTFTNGMFNA